MQIETKAAGNILVVKPLGRRLDARAASAFKEQMVNLITKGHHQIALNLAEVDFIDSSGLGALVSSLKNMGAAGDMVIYGAKETVLRVFTLTRLDKIFCIHPQEEDALATLSA